MTALHSRRSFLAAASVGTLAFAGRASATTTGRGTDTPTGTAAGSTPPNGTTTDGTATKGTPRSSPSSPTPTPVPVGDHRTFGVDPARSGYAPDEAGPVGPIAFRWCVGSGGSNRLTPLAVVDDVVYTGSPSEGLRALDATTGETLWRAEVDGYPGAPTVVGDRVVLTSSTGVAALGLESGRELWSTRVENGPSTSVLVAGTGSSQPEPDADWTAFVATDDTGGDSSGGLYALAADGSIRWETSLAPGPLYGHLAAGDGLVFGGGTRSVHAIDAATGEARWRVHAGEHATDPAVGERAVFVGDEAGTVHALAAVDGSVLWTYETGAEVRTSPAVADGVVYVPATDGYCHAVDAATGERRWRFDGGRRLTCSPAVAGGDRGGGGRGNRDRMGNGDGATVYLGSAQGNVFAVDADGGALRWSRQLTDHVETAPVVLDGHVFVGDAEGRVHALTDESAASSADPGGCRSVTATPTDKPGDGGTDADGDGVPDRRDYAPRDGSVQRRSDLAADDGDDDRGFLAGVGVGAVVSAFGTGVGWWLGRREGGGADGEPAGPDGTSTDR